MYPDVQIHALKLQLGLNGFLFLFNFPLPIIFHLDLLIFAFCFMIKIGTVQHDILHIFFSMKVFLICLYFLHSQLLIVSVFNIQTGNKSEILNAQKSPSRSKNNSFIKITKKTPLNLTKLLYNLIKISKSQNGKTLKHRDFMGNKLFYLYCKNKLSFENRLGATEIL